MIAVVALLVAYLLGSISFSWLAVRLVLGTDLRSQGSGNLGAKNTLRSLGVLPAILVFLGDASKGWLALFLSTIIAPDINLLLPASLCVILGHLFPCWLKFQGGKGLSSTVGFTLYLNPILMISLLLTAALGLALTRKTNPAAIIALITFPVFFYLTVPQPLAWLWGAAIAAPMLYRHRRDFPDLFKAIKLKG